jgi:radical SAM superfamily enzyme YgiQ (UPF0313 family)
MKIALVVAEEKPQGCPSLGVAYIAAYLRKHLKGLKIKIWSWVDDFKEIVKFNPDVVGISAITPQMNTAIKLSKKIKKKLNALVVLGGSHISALPYTLPESFDIGVIGEGEVTFKEIVELYREKGSATVKGVAVRLGGSVFVTEKREQMKVDSIPYPARDLLDMKHFLKKGNTFGVHFGKGAHVFGSRGCPYKCTFCASSSFWQRVRYNTPEHVVKEIEMLIKDYGVELIHLYDDLLIYNKKGLKRMAELIRKKGIHKKVKFGVFGRVDVFDKGVCEDLKRMNVVHVNFGAESGCQRTLDFLKNGKIKVWQTRKAVALARKYGFTVDASFIIGSPDETEEEMMQTLRFIKSLRLNKFGHYIATPYPGTRLWELARDQGVVSPDMDWSQFWMSRRHIKWLGDQLMMSNTMSRWKLWRIWKKFEKERLKLFDYKWQDKFQGGKK